MEAPISTAQSALSALRRLWLVAAVRQLARAERTVDRLSARADEGRVKVPADTVRLEREEMLGSVDNRTPYHLRVSVNALVVQPGVPRNYIEIIIEEDSEGSAKKLSEAGRDPNH
jgi:hypothetical protein